MAHDRTASLSATHAKPARAASRRELLKGLSLAGFAAGSSVVAAVPARADQPPADSANLHFEETDHVRTFYDLARR